MDKYSTMTLVLSLLMASGHPANSGDGYHTQRFHCDPGACLVQHAEALPKLATRQSNLCRVEKPDSDDKGG